MEISIRHLKKTSTKAFSVSDFLCLKDSLNTAHMIIERHLCEFQRLKLNQRSSMKRCNFEFDTWQTLYYQFKQSQKSNKLYQVL